MGRDGRMGGMAGFVQRAGTSKERKDVRTYARASPDVSADDHEQPPWPAKPGQHHRREQREWDGRQGCCVHGFSGRLQRGPASEAADQQLQPPAGRSRPRDGWPMTTAGREGCAGQTGSHSRASLWWIQGRLTALLAMAAAAPSDLLVSFACTHSSL